jgi:hypothetical protein
MCLNNIQEGTMVKKYDGVIFDLAMARDNRLADLTAS